MQKTQTTYIKRLNKSKLSLCLQVLNDFLSCGHLDKLLLVPLLFSNTFLFRCLFIKYFIKVCQELTPV